MKHPMEIDENVLQQLVKLLNLQGRLLFYCTIANKPDFMTVFINSVYM